MNYKYSKKPIVIEAFQMTLTDKPSLSHLEEQSLADLGEAIDTSEEDEEAGETAAEEAKPRKSMRKAINDMCYECTYDPCGEGNWRQQVGACTVTKCPLWEFRPMSRPRKEKIE